MRPLRWLAGFSLCAILAAGCSGVADLRPETYVVQPADTLYSIAWRFDLNFKDLAAWNDLGSGYRIEPGQILLLRPTGAGAPRAAAKPPVAAPAVSTQSSTRPSVHRDIPRVEKPRPLPDLVPAATAWVWPTQSLGQPVAVAGGGLMIHGGLGQDVNAAAAGKVVYVGSGLRGYGNLVIIKHSDAILSAYAHNREVAVREGQVLQAGERIGAMGLGPRQIPALYFEIRLNGKPVPVKPFLEHK